ncbi:hypothetical protein KRP22_006291 [Phytophthora ramorum]|nr:hypothetical protein KRP22_2577 [Phytophthora ramorum]
MGKERFIPSPFGELILSDTDKVALKDFAYSFFEAQVAKYEDFITDEGFRVNERDWKYMKSKEGSRVQMSPLEIAKEYATGLGKQTISFASIDSSLSSSMSD